MERRPASIKLPKNFQPNQRFGGLSSALWEEKLTSRDLKVLEALLLGNEIDSSAGWHTPRQTLDATLLEVRDRFGPVRDDGDRVAGGDESALSVNHVTITVTIGGCTKGDVVLLNGLDQRVSVRQVGIWVSSTEVGGWDAVLDGRSGKTKRIDEDGAGIGAGNAMETVKQDIETLGVEEEVLDQVKVENRLEELDVVGDGINDFNFQGAVLGFSFLRKVDLEWEAQLRHGRGCAWVGTYGSKLENLVLGDSFGLLEDFVGDVLRSGATVGHIVLDTKVVVWSTRVVRCRKKNTTIGLVLPDDIGRGGS